MRGCTVDSVIIEIGTLEPILLRRIEKYIQSDDIVNAAKGLIATNQEIYKIDEDARKLRLAGQLDVQVYEALTKDYKQISDKIMKIAYERKLAHEISALHKALRFTNDAKSVRLSAGGGPMKEFCPRWRESRSDS